MHLFSGAVSIAGAEDGLWAVRGGNRQVPEMLLQKSRANLVRAQVCVPELSISFN